MTKVIKEVTSDQSSREASSFAKKLRRDETASRGYSESDREQAAWQASDKIACGTGHQRDGQTCSPVRTDVASEKE
jgi:hypothetical protein